MEPSYKAYFPQNAPIDCQDFERDVRYRFACPHYERAWKYEFNCGIIHITTVLESSDQIISGVAQKYFDRSIIENGIKLLDQHAFEWVKIEGFETKSTMSIIYLPNKNNTENQKKVFTRLQQFIQIFAVEYNRKWQVFPHEVQVQVRTPMREKINFFREYNHKSIAV